MSIDIIFCHQITVFGKLFGIKFYKTNKISFENICKFFYFKRFFYCSVIFFIKNLKINLDKNIITISFCFLLFDPNIHKYIYTFFGE